MDSKTKASITIHYLLDEAGRREALSLGMSATEQQTIVVGPEDDGFDEALALASVSTDGDAVLEVGLDSEGGGTPRGAWMPNEDGTPTHVRRLVQWSAPQSAEVLIAWKQEYVGESLRIEAEKEASMAAYRLECEAEEKAEKIKEVARQEIQREESLADLEEIVSGMTGEEKNSEYMVDRLKNARRDIRAMGGRDPRGFLNPIRQCLASIREDVVVETWIAECGSDRLRRCVAEGIECDAIYRDERLAYERPGWRWSDEVRGDSDVPRNPPTDAFALLDEARTFDGDAGIEYWTARERATDEAVYYGEDETDRPWEFRGYVATARFLDREIVFFGDQDVPE